MNRSMFLLPAILFAVLLYLAAWIEWSYNIKDKSTVNAVRDQEAPNSSTSDLLVEVVGAGTSGKLLANRERHLANEDPPQSNKRGLIIGSDTSESNLKLFNRSSISWFYNYRQIPSEIQNKWADANGVEFVPMIPKPYLNHEDGESVLCYFDAKRGNVPKCSRDDAVALIKKSVDDHVKVKAKYLLGFNEMYNNPLPEGNDIDPKKAAYYWGKYIQPAAVASRLQLVSPSTGILSKPAAIVWFSNFLKRCYDRRDPKQFFYTCDIWQIKKIAIHDYGCRESRLVKNYGEYKSLFVTRLLEELNGYGGVVDWEDYLQRRSLWITETNCYWESTKPHLDSRKQCLRITGQKQKTHGNGSIAAMERLANIERYAWWTSWDDQSKPNFQIYRFSNQLTPAGRGYLRPGDRKVNCEFPGKRISVNDDTVRKIAPAETIQCGGTGTHMIR